MGLYNSIWQGVFKFKFSHFSVKVTRWGQIRWFYILLCYSWYALTKLYTKTHGRAWMAVKFYNRKMHGCLNNVRRTGYIYYIDLQWLYIDVAVNVVSIYPSSHVWFLGYFPVFRWGAYMCYATFHAPCFVCTVCVAVVFLSCFRPLLKWFDKKYFLTLPLDTCRERRR